MRHRAHRAGVKFFPKRDILIFFTAKRIWNLKIPLKTRGFTLEVV
jgi:hypothetical protein